MLRSSFIAIVALAPLGCGSPEAPPGDSSSVVTPANPSSAAHSDQALTPQDDSSRAEPTAPTALDPRELDRLGDEHLKAGRFKEAVTAFDAAIAQEPRLEPYHWRRGIAHYYAGMYEEGIAQFELHRSVNGNDVENAAWHFLCLARRESPSAAERRILPVGPDSRVPMMLIYEMFAGRKSPGDVLAAAESVRDARQAESALFYGHLYVGLYHEVQGNAALAEKHIRMAATEHTSPHYMGDVARVHAALLEASPAGR